MAEKQIIDAMWDDTPIDVTTEVNFIPDAMAFFEEKADAKSPVIKTGAEIPFTRYFYKYQQPTPGEELEQRFLDLEKPVNERIAKLFG